MTDAADTTDAGSDETDDLGTVYLVGSGPGDPGLLTVRARELLDEADVVLHDKLPGSEIIESIPPDRREDVGKRASTGGTSQTDRNERLVELAREGKEVVRLKGGDPFVFGRGGEEAEHLASEGIPFEIVPGVTSAVAAPGAAGIPVTHRDHASSVSFVTGHEDPTKAESSVDWAALAETGGTLVVLMGVGRLPDYTAALREAGMDSDTPVALVERGTWPDARVAVGTLESIVHVRDEAGIEPPAVTVIGDVAGTRERVVQFLRGRGGPRATVDGVGDVDSGGSVDSVGDVATSAGHGGTRAGDDTDDIDDGAATPDSERPSVDDTEDGVDTPGPAGVGRVSTDGRGRAEADGSGGDAEGFGHADGGETNGRPDERGCETVDENGGGDE